MTIMANRPAVELLERHRWGHTPVCPLCGDLDVYKMKDRKTGERSRRFLWRCRACARQYTVRIGTVMEDSKVPASHWVFAIWAASTSPNGVSAKEIHYMTGLSYDSALILMHRIRWATAEDLAA